MPRKGKMYELEAPAPAPVWDRAAEPDDEDDEDDSPDRPIRSEHRAEMLALKALANRIAGLPAGIRRTLPLDEETQAQIELLIAADQRPDRRRVLMRAKLLLAGADLPALEAALAGHTPAALLERRLQGWATRILDGDEQVIQSFVESYPRADRQAIRACVRQVRALGAEGADGPAAKAARDRLMRQLRDAARES